MAIILHAAVLLTAVVLLAATRASALPLVEQGQPRAVLVTADEPSPVARFAAEELTHHVEKATGVALPIVGESQAPVEGRRHVYIGVTEAAAAQGIRPDELPPDALLLRSVGNDLYVLGIEDDRDPLDQSARSGTLYGVYELLHRYVGVRWLWPGDLGTHISRTDTLRVTATGPRGGPCSTCTCKQGVYPPPGTSLAIPVSDLNPQAGTLSFWFRLDWSDPSYQHAMLAELLAGDAWQLRWRYGYPHIPSYIYVTLDTGPNWDGGKVGGGFRADSHNLFTGGEWRHYALRWCAERAAIEMIVDGYRTPGHGRYTSDQREPLAARLLLHGEVRGAFDEVRIYDRWLDDDALLAAGGVTRVRAYLQEQQPPPGAPRAGGIGREISYVEPGTGQLVTSIVTDAGAIYNPDDMPELPETPHTKWARPLAGGPLKALLIMPADFYDDRSSLREGVELWQRLDMVCDIVTKPDDEVMRRDYDVIVVGHQGHRGILCGWWSEPEKHGTFMDAKVRQWLTDRVLSGKSGLVLANPKW